MDIQEFTPAKKSQTGFAVDLVAKAAALGPLMNIPLFQLEILTEIQERHQSFQRLVDSLNSQGHFIASFVNSPVLDAVRKISEAQEQLRMLVESPFGRIVEDMQKHLESIKSISVPWAEIVLRQSQLHQQVLQALHNVNFAERFQPILDIDGLGTLTEPLYVVDFPDPSEDASEESSIVQVTGLIGPEIIKFFHKHPDALKTMDRRKFEEFVAELFRGFGFEVELTARTRDGGKDVIAISRHAVHVKHLIECKRPDPGNPVRIEQVRALLGVKVSDKATKAILATTTHFTPDSMKMFNDHEWELEPRDFEGLQDWIRRYLGIPTPRLLKPGAP